MKRYLFVLLLALLPLRGNSCTSVIVSGKVTPDGRPLMLKNRDQKFFDNYVVRFQGEKYAFIGIQDTNSKGKERVVGGTNEAGFSVMSTSIRNTTNEKGKKTVITSFVLSRALGSCATLEEFEQLLDRLDNKNLKSSIGAIDARGGAAYYQFNQGKWYKLDVNDPAVAPEGWKVVSNYSVYGDMEKKQNWAGYSREQVGIKQMKELDLSSLTPWTLLDAFSRRWSNHYMRVDYSRDYDTLMEKGWFNGMAYDVDFIARHSTVSVMVFEGREKPVMWTLLGYPGCGVTVPVPVLDKEYLPAYMLPGEDGKSLLCTRTLSLKDRWVYDPPVSNALRYVHLDRILRGTEGRPALLDAAQAAERRIRADFLPLQEQREKGEIEEGVFARTYRAQSEKYLRYFEEEFAPFFATPSGKL